MLQLLGATVNSLRAVFILCTEFLLSFVDIAVAPPQLADVLAALGVSLVHCSAARASTGMRVPPST